MELWHAFKVVQMPDIHWNLRAKYILKSIPSGIFQEGKLNIIGNGVVIDPALFKQEVEALEKVVIN